MNTRILQLYIPCEQTLLLLLGGIIISFLFAYAYFINASVLYVVERTAAEKETAVVLSRISSLETEYFSASEYITLSLAQSLGFKEVEQAAFVHSKSLTARALTLQRR